MNESELETTLRVLKAHGIEKLNLQCTYDTDIEDEDDEGNDVTGMYSRIDDEYSFEGTVEEFKGFFESYGLWGLEDGDLERVHHDYQYIIEGDTLYGFWNNSCGDRSTDRIPDSMDGITYMEYEVKNQCGHVIREVEWDGEDMSTKDIELTLEQREEVHRYELEQQNALCHQHAVSDAIDFRRHMIKRYALNRIPVGTEVVTETEREWVVYITATMTAYNPEYGDIVDLSIVNGYGTTLLSSRYGPVGGRLAWGEDSDGIRYEDVASLCPFPLSEDVHRVTEIMSHARVCVCYGDAVLHMLAAAGVGFPDGMKTCDLLRRFAAVYGEWSDYYNDWKFQKMDTAFCHYKIKTDRSTEGKATCLIRLCSCISSEPEEVRNRPRDDR